MGDSPTSSRTSMSYEDTWNTNEPYEGDFWDEDDQQVANLLSDSVPPDNSVTPDNSEGIPENPEEDISEEEENQVVPEAEQDDSDETITEGNEDNNLQSSSSVAIFETPMTSQLLEMIPEEEKGAAVVTATPSPEVKIEFDVPTGRYRLVGLNVNLTGNRLVDEICQISSYTPKDRFNLFVMPHGNPNNYMRENYGLMISSGGAIRTLRDIITRRNLKTRTDVAALMDFIIWLEKIKGDADGIVLIFHDIRCLVHLKLIQALKHFDLLDRFKDVVKGFCNICTLAQNNSEQKYFSLKALSNFLLPQRHNNRRGVNKARLCYDVLIELLTGAHTCTLNTNLSRANTNRMSDVELIRQVCENIIQHLDNLTDEVELKIDVTELIHKYSMSVDAEERKLLEFEMILERQNSFRSVFKDLMNFNNPIRLIINRVRRKIVNQNYSFKDVEEAWNCGKVQGLLDFFNNIALISRNEFDLIVEIFERHFDPELLSYYDLLMQERTKEKKPKQEEQKLEEPTLPQIPEEDENEKEQEEKKTSATKGHRRVNSV